MFKEDNTEKELLDVDPEVLEASKEIYYVSEGRMKIDKYKVTKLETGKNLFFISDLHFSHANIINLANRPFKDVLEMNKTLIENWNNTVSKSDTVFILGDFCFGQASVWEKLLRQLNGNKVLILGNHKNY